jgi:hypothetical protein
LSFWLIDVSASNKHNLVTPRRVEFRSEHQAQHQAHERHQVQKQTRAQLQGGKQREARTPVSVLLLDRAQTLAPPLPAGLVTR